MKFSSIVRPVLLGCAAALCACATGDAISKVKIFRLDASEPLRAADPAISFEQRHYLHGAITAEEVRAREGNYYTIYFSLADPSQPVTLRFEYRQAGTGSKVLVIEKPDRGPGSKQHHRHRRRRRYISAEWARPRLEGLARARQTGSRFAPLVPLGITPCPAQAARQLTGGPFS